MAEFTFRLERVLRVKELLEERLQGEVAQKKQRTDAARLEVESLKERLAEREDQLRRLQNGVLSIDRTLLLMDFIAHLKKRLAESKSRLESYEADLERARAALLEAMKERKTLELLRDRDLQAYQRDLARREQKEMDEMAQRSRARGGRRL